MRTMDNRRKAICIGFVCTTHTVRKVDSFFSELIEENMHEENPIRKKKTQEMNK